MSLTVTHCHWVYSSQSAGPPTLPPLPEAPRGPLDVAPSALAQRLDRGEPAYLFGGLIFVAARPPCKLPCRVNPGLRITAILTQFGQLIFQKNKISSATLQNDTI